MGAKGVSKQPTINKTNSKSGTSPHRNSRKMTNDKKEIVNKNLGGGVVVLDQKQGSMRPTQKQPAKDKQAQLSYGTFNNYYVDSNTDGGIQQNINVYNFN
jgi:hypothetical protein